MNKPKMILFDYGQTLMTEPGFDGISGTKAVLKHCVDNPLHVTAEEIQAFADELNEDIGRYHPETQHLALLEVHNHPFQNYLYEFFGIKPTVTPLELETVFWDNAAPAVPTNGISEFLKFLKEKDIRSGVISNIGMSGAALANRIHTLLPDNSFEFIIASSEYVFRKPSKRIFELAARKAGLEPKDIWYCGDNVKCDIEGAHNSSMIPVWYKGAMNRNASAPQFKCLEIDNWEELRKYLQSMEPHGSCVCIP